MRRSVLIALTIAMLLLLGAGLWAVVHFTHTANPSTVKVDLMPRSAALPPPLEQGFLPIAPEKAEEINARMPTSTAPVEPALPFLQLASASTPLGRQAAVDCLTEAIYYEAASEDDRGQRAVAQVVLNRVRHPAFPKSICGVVYQGSERSTGCQFTFTCDGSLARKPSQAGWNRARGIALAALGGFVERSVGTATHYHTVWVVPYWAWSLDKVATEGNHIFYRWKGGWGRRSAFSGIYAGETTTDEAKLVMPDPGVFSIPTAPTLSGPRPLADEIEQLARPQAAPTAQTSTPSADIGAGTLVADENAGTLIGPGRPEN